MKKLLLFTVLLSALMTADAQSRWAFGLEVEGGLSGQRDEKSEQFASSDLNTYSIGTIVRRRPGMSVGGWSEVLLGRRIGLRLGVNYARLGGYAQHEEIGRNAAGDLDFHLRDRYSVVQHQLRIPLAVKLYFGPPTWRRRPFVSTGVQATHLIKQRAFINNYYGTAFNAEEIDNSYEMETDLDGTYADLKRFRTFLITGIGVAGPRISLSLQRTWGTRPVDAAEGLYHDCDCYGFCNCLVPEPVVPHTVRFLQLTSLRFAYRL